jgi:hypothetical protein
VFGPCPSAPEPHEVIERIAEWLKSNTNPLVSEEDSASRFRSSLAVNPWFDLARTQLRSAGENLRHFAAEDIAVPLGTDKRLQSIADKLDAAGAHPLAIGMDSWKALQDYVVDAVNEAAQLKAEHIDTSPFRRRPGRTAWNRSTARRASLPI